ncbi:MAG: CoA transferase [Chloroflexi bacterium]|nr:CoA transferase [Chloroflexota bacterium]
MAGALEDIRVIDFGQYIAGPLTAMLLADQGAEVIRVDPPGGPRWKTPANATWNRGKRSILLDLKTAADRETARRLVAATDVVVENFRPGVMERLGLGPEAMTAGNPHLVYCSIPGFASDDPRAGLPAWEGVVAAATDTYRPAPGSDRPVYTAIPIASHFAAFQSAIAITMALIARQRCGLGQRLEVPLFDAMFAAIGANGLLVGGQRGGGRPDDFWGGVMQCADGRWVHFSAATPRFRRRFMEAARIQSWEAEGLLNLTNLAADAQLQGQFRERLRALFRTRTALEWEDLCGRAEVPLAICRTTEEWMATGHARQAEIVVPVDDPVLGAMLQPGLPVRLSGAPGGVRGPAPLPDADRPWVLSTLGAVRTWPSTRNGAQPLRAALEGMRVVDTTQVLAGPTAGRTLAEYGADVVKINNPREEGAGYRTNVHRYHTDVNRGKRSLLLDLKSPRGLEVFWRLVEGADVLLQNFRLGVADRLGMGYQQVKARKPDIVYVNVSAFGYGGPFGARPGYEIQGQAVTGLEERAGGSGQPAGQPFAVNDYGTGLMGAFGASLALYHRQRTGQGQQAEAALAYTGTILQSPFLQQYRGKTWNEPRGREALGSGPLHRLYRARDGWFFLGARPDQLARVADVAGLRGIGGVQDQALERALEERLADDTVAQWVAQLATAGVGAHRLAAVDELMRDPWVAQHGLSVTRRHDSGLEITTIGPGARLSHTPVVPGRPAPTPGASAPEVLGEIGMADQTEELLGNGVLLVETMPPRPAPVG